MARSHQVPGHGTVVVDVRLITKKWSPLCRRRGSRSRKFAKRMMLRGANTRLTDDRARCMHGESGTDEEAVVVWYKRRPL